MANVVTIAKGLSKIAGWGKKLLKPASQYSDDVAKNVGRVEKFAKPVTKETGKVVENAAPAFQTGEQAVETAGRSAGTSVGSLLSKIYHSKEFKYVAGAGALYGGSQYAKEHGGLAPWVAEQAVDIGFGRGTYDKVSDKVSEVTNETRVAIDKTAETMRQTFERAGNQTGQLQYDGNYYSESQQGGGSLISNLLSPFSTLKNILSAMMNGNSNTLALAALLPAAWLSFGHFGWMGKMVSILLGTTAVSGLSNKMQNSVLVDNKQNVQHAISQQGKVDLRNKDMYDDLVYRPKDTEEQVIMRSRGI